MRKVKIIVNDFHLGKGPVLKDGTLNILEDFRFGRKFVEFLAYYSSGEYEDCHVELIINGDFLNLLQIDYLGVHTYLMTEKMMAHCVRSIISGHSEVFDALKNFASQPKKEIAYIIGNHDIGLLFDEPRKVLREAVGKNLRFYDTYYEFNGVRVEHGHMYEAINATHPQKFKVKDPDFPDPVLNLPWASLFVASFLPKIKKERPFVDKVKPFTGYMRWALLHDTLFALRTFFFITFSFIRMFFLARRHPLLDFNVNWAKIKGTTIYPSFVKEARKILKQNSHLNAVIFGHTHVLRYRQWGGGKEYFNTGTWNEVTSLDIADFGLQTLLTYGYVELFDGSLASQKPQIRLKEWKGEWRPEEETSIMPIGK
ncbi:MAG: metallophosphoesterase [Oligoflexia bacterium]|nr:metallophosphoesterase [Oligoflexia bacterium]